MALTVEHASRQALSETAPSPLGAARLLQRARDLEAQGDIDAAAAVLRRAAKAPSHAGYALAELGRIDRVRGRAHDALSTYKWALHHLDDARQVAWIYAEIGELYLGMQEHTEAEYYFRRAAGLDARHAHLLDSIPEPESGSVHELVTADIDIGSIQ